MKAAVILAILGAAAALPAPQGPPPAVVPTAGLDEPVDGPMGGKPTGGAGMAKPTGAPPMDKSMGMGEHKSFDNGQWSQWAGKTGGAGGFHPTKTFGGAGPTGGWGHHKRPSGTGSWGHNKRPSGTGSWGNGGPHKRPTGTGAAGGLPTPHGPAKPTMPADDEPAGDDEMPAGDNKMSILPVEPEPTMMVRRGLDINYHLAPRHGGEDEEETPKGQGPAGDDEDDEDDEDAQKEQEKQQKKQEKEEKKKQKEAEKERKKYTSVVEDAPIGGPTPTWNGTPGAPGAHGTGMPSRKGRPQGSGFSAPSGAKPTGMPAFPEQSEQAGRPKPETETPTENTPEDSETPAEPSILPGQTRPGQTKPANPEAETETPTEEEEAGAGETEGEGMAPTPTVKSPSSMPTLP